jgi:hypothetical protein
MGYEDVKSSCVASLEAVAAMAHVLAKNQFAAEAALQRAAKLAEECDGRDYVQGNQIRPYWFDWAIAELVIAEAESRVHPASN